MVEGRSLGSKNSFPRPKFSSGFSSGTPPHPRWNAPKGLPALRRRGRVPAAMVGSGLLCPGLSVLSRACGGTITRESLKPWIQRHFFLTERVTVRQRAEAETDVRHV